ncbi:TolC family protein [Nannocystis sp. ILAH1]|uniref:TolC family protein n=1 Tax=unclassified Nannocystis TaxID=2627009 RepID=UPI00226F9FAD|nr:MULTISPECIES: TolC family protein [unclassified Nannocystis]MCY0987416.1 TolC family protein [Nannocystis sp. ILAH1]MCY1070788.1 TolC family protein [Nannocystis sp. RBIL2]
MPLLSALLTAVLLAAPPPSAGCQGPLGRAAVVACALAEHPSIRAAEAGRAAAEGRKLGARTLLPSNPQVEVTAGRRVGLWNGERDINVYGRVAQELEIAGQRRKRMAMADAEVTQADRQVELSRRDVAAAALSAYFEWIAAREQQAMIGRIAKTAETLVDLARTSERTGLGSGLNADVVVATSVRVRRQQIEADRRVAAARAVLAGLLGRDGAGLEVEGELKPLALPQELSALLTSALTRRAEIELAKAEREVFLRQVEVFRRLRAPNPSVVLYAQRDGFAEQVLGGGLAFPIVLPAPLGRTYKGEIAESKALARRAEAEVERWRRVVQAEVEVALREVEARKAELELFEAERLQRAEGHLEALAQEMATGRVSIRDAVVLQQTLLEYLAAHIEARRALALGSVELARVAGLLPEGAQR